MRRTKTKNEIVPVGNVPTGISGFNEITGGRAPEGRPTVVCGPAGRGKSLFAPRFLMRGTQQFCEPGLLLIFDENVDDVRKDVASLGFNVNRVVVRKKVISDYLHVERSENFEQLKAMITEFSNAKRSTPRTRSIHSRVPPL